MPSPKAGTPGTLVPPAAPDEAKDADEADPGQVESVKAGEREAQSGKYGATPVKPHKKPQTQEEAEQKRSWIEIVLRDEEGKGVPGAKYKITLPDESVAEGTLDGAGKARVEGIDPGICQITFPDFHPDIWSPA